jgi:predicted DsbA family dithiol-disulfide isomerase
MGGGGPTEGLVVEVRVRTDLNCPWCFAGHLSMLNVLRDSGLPVEGAKEEGEGSGGSDEQLRVRVRYTPAILFADAALLAEEDGSRQLTPCMQTLAIFASVAAAVIVGGKNNVGVDDDEGDGRPGGGVEGGLLNPSRRIVPTLAAHTLLRVVRDEFAATHPGLHLAVANALMHALFVSCDEVKTKQDLEQVMAAAGAAPEVCSRAAALAATEEARAATAAEAAEAAGKPALHYSVRLVDGGGGGTPLEWTGADDPGLLEEAIEIMAKRARTLLARRGA